MNASSARDVPCVAALPIRANVLKIAHRTALLLWPRGWFRRKLVAH
jgi:hypothetical protein